MKKALILKALAFVVMLLTTFPLASCGFVERLIGLKADRTYVIHFNANGGEGEMDDYLVESGDDGWLPKCAFTKEGYECVAWGLDPDGTDFATQIDNLTFKLPFSVKNGDTVQLYAVWTTPGFSFELSTMGFFASADITAYEGNASHVIVPAWYEGSFGGSAYGSCRVDTIAPEAFMGHTEIKRVENIRDDSLSHGLFRGCASLEGIGMWKDSPIRAIGDRTFYQCSALQSLPLTAKLKSIGEEAFYMCTSIEKLVIPSLLDRLGDRAFFGWTENQVIEFTKYSENPFGDGAFDGCGARVIWSGT